MDAADADAADAVDDDDGDDDNNNDDDDDYDDHIADAFEKAHIESFGNPWSEQIIHGHFATSPKTWRIFVLTTHRMGLNSLRFPNKNCANRNFQGLLVES